MPLEKPDADSSRSRKIEFTENAGWIDKRNFGAGYIARRNLFAAGAHWSVPLGAFRTSKAILMRIRLDRQKSQFFLSPPADGRSAGEPTSFHHDFAALQLRNYISH